MMMRDKRISQKPIALLTAIGVALTIFVFDKPSQAFATCGGQTAGAYTNVLCGVSIGPVTPAAPSNPTPGAPPPPPSPWVGGNPACLWATGIVTYTNVIGGGPPGTWYSSVIATPNGGSDQGPTVVDFGQAPNRMMLETSGPDATLTFIAGEYVYVQWKAEDVNGVCDPDWSNRNDWYAYCPDGSRYSYTYMTSRYVDSYFGAVTDPCYQVSVAGPPPSPPPPAPPPAPPAPPPPPAAMGPSAAVFASYHPIGVTAKAPANGNEYVGVPGCFWVDLAGYSDTQDWYYDVTQYWNGSSWQTGYISPAFTSTIRFWITGKLGTVTWNYGDGSIVAGNEGQPWTGAGAPCTNPHAFAKVTDNGSSYAITANENWDYKAQYAISTNWGYSSSGNSIFTDCTGVVSNGGQTCTLFASPPGSSVTALQSEGIPVSAGPVCSGLSGAPTPDIAAGIVGDLITFTAPSVTCTGGTPQYQLLQDGFVAVPWQNSRALPWNSAQYCPNICYPNLAGNHSIVVQIRYQPTGNASGSSLPLNYYLHVCSAPTAVTGPNSVITGNSYTYTVSTHCAVNAVKTYNWFLDGGNVASNSPSPTWTWVVPCSSPGIHNVAAWVDGTLVGVTETASANPALKSPLYPVTVSNSSAPVVSETATPNNFPVPPGTASFTGTVAAGTGCAPFTHSWAFGDSGTSTLANPVHTYLVAGTYIARDTVTDAIGQTGVGSVTVVVGSPLTAAISASPASGNSPLPVAFQGIPSGGSGGYTYAWNFGDATTGTGQYVSHTYAPVSSASYTVTLVITDSGARTATATTTISVTNNPNCWWGSTSDNHPSPTNGYSIYTVYSNSWGCNYGGSPNFNYDVQFDGAGATQYWGGWTGATSWTINLNNVYTPCSWRGHTYTDFVGIKDSRVGGAQAYSQSNGGYWLNVPCS